MEAVAERAARTGPAPTKPVRRARRPARRRVASGVVWIVVVAVLLGGVVTMNVAVLRLNLRMDGLNRERVRVKADIATYSSQLSSSAATARIETMAHQRYGLVPANPAETTYVELGR